MEALQYIEKAINDHPTTGQARRLVRFLAGLYNGQDYPFDLSELRGLDTKLASARNPAGPEAPMNAAGIDLLSEAEIEQLAERLEPFRSSGATGTRHRSRAFCD
jgi:hypothetical protein